MHTARFSRAVRWLVVMLACAAAQANAHDSSGGLMQLDMPYAGLQRSYALHVPASIAGKPAPLVIVLHGLGGSGRQVVAQGRWLQASQRFGFILLAPDGSLEHPGRRASFLGNKRSWNAGHESGSTAEQRDVDDIGFLRVLIARISSRYPVDPDRIYVTGFSNGAAMAFRAAAQLKGIAAVAPVSNALLVPVKPMSRPVSLLLIWGDRDPLNPPGGGAIKRPGGVIHRPSALQSLAAWGRAMHCGTGTVSDNYGPGVQSTKMQGCPAPSTAEFLLVKGMGHQWPGGKDYLRLFAGPGSDALDATAVIWHFFAEHPISASRQAR